MKLGNVRDTFASSAIQITSVAMTSNTEPDRPKTGRVSGRHRLKGSTHLSRAHQYARDRLIQPPEGGKGVGISPKPAK